MTVSFVLRLVSDRLQDGHVVGEAEFVPTGERLVVGDVDALVEFLRRSVTDSTEG